MLTTMDIKKIFGNNIRYYRKKRGMTQESLAEKLEVTGKHLGAIESGQTFVSAELIEKASSVLDVSPASLFYSETEKDGSDSFIDKIDSLIQEELDSAKETLRNRLHQQ